LFLEFECVYVILSIYITVGSSSFEQALLAEQQKALVQAVVFKLTDISFDQCVPKPSSSLSYSEQSCITSVVGKYLETTDIVVGRLSAAASGSNHRT